MEPSSKCRNRGWPADAIAAVPENHDVLITGTVIRQEQVIEGNANISWSCRKDSGTRVAPGEILFQENSPDLQQWAQNEIVEAQAVQYRNENLVRRREWLWELIRTGTEQENGTELKALLLAESEWPETESAALPGTDLRTIALPEDGIFAQGVDGLENLLTPEHPTIPYALLPMNDPQKTALGNSDYLRYLVLFGPMGRCPGRRRNRPGGAAGWGLRNL